MAKKPKDPAGNPALAPTIPVEKGVDSAKTGQLIPSAPAKSALAPDSRRGATPATDVAEERHVSTKNRISEDAQLGVSLEMDSDIALARHVSRVAIYREGDVEYMIVNGKRLYRDTYIGAQLGLSRPRDIRKTVERVIKRGDIAPNQYMAITEDDVTVYYVDSESSVLLAFNSNAGDKKTMVMKVLGRIRGVEEADRPGMSMKDALAGYDKATSYIARKEAPRAAKIAKLPLLERFCREAGIAMPDVSELLGPETPRLPGV